MQVYETPKQTPLQRKVNRLIKKCEKQGYKFSEIDLGMFEALGREGWDEEKVGWLPLRHFNDLYDRFYLVK